MGNVDIVANDKLSTWYDNVKFMAIIKACDTYIENMCAKLIRARKLTADAGAYYKGKYVKEVEAYASVIKRAYILAGGRVESLIRVLAKCIRTAFDKHARELNLGSYLSLYITNLEKLTANISGQEEINERLKVDEIKETKPIPESNNIELQPQPVKENIKEEKPKTPTAEEIARAKLDNINKQLADKTNSSTTLEERNKKLIEKEKLEQVLNTSKQPEPKTDVKQIFKERAPEKSSDTKIQSTIKPNVKPIPQQKIQTTPQPQVQKTITLEQKLKQMTENSSSQQNTKIKEAKKTTVGTATGGLNDISRLKSLTEDKH